VEPLELLAERHNYQVTTLLLGGCNYGAASDTRSSGCNRFNEAATAYALKMRPDAVLTMATRSDKKTNAERAVAGLPEAAAVLGEAGIRVVGIRDNPRFTFNMIRCVEEHGAESDQCTFPLSEKLAATPPVPPAEASNGALRFIDMTDLICPDGTCSPVVGNVYVYLDDNHLTTTYTKTTLPEFEKRFHDALL
jgi:hypothetical protein